MSLVEALAEFKEKEGVSDILNANWYTIATTALAASSAGPEVVKLYRFATKDLDLEKQKLVQRRIKEAVIKTSILYGGPKALQALFPLFKDLKEEEIDSYGPRYDSLNDPNDGEKRKEKGRRFFEKLWTPGAAQENLDFNKKYSPDLYLMTLHSLEWTSPRTPSSTSWRRNWSILLL
ncbi:hypothetical protein PRZ48_010443 [Zasmidium cellare]|uniref:Uncharacterized protein n=1 Tax=Zasmidium cellare TaxID=395010 RepID=A0ABR0E901_ZASCE|nr:hypothetical protein PRZ48_010443 [Zasmidium cellare]